MGEKYMNLLLSSMYLLNWYNTQQYIADNPNINIDLT